MKELVEYQQTDAYRSFVAKQEVANRGKMQCMLMTAAILPLDMCIVQTCTLYILPIQLDTVVLQLLSSLHALFLPSYLLASYVFCDWSIG